MTEYSSWKAVKSKLGNARWSTTEQTQDYEAPFVGKVKLVVNLPLQDKIDFAKACGNRTMTDVIIGLVRNFNQ